MTAERTSTTRAAEGQALACPPEVLKWLHDEVVQRVASVVAVLGSGGPLRRADQARGCAELEVALGALRLLLNDGVERPPQRRFRTVGEAVRAASVVPAGRAVQLQVAGDAEVPSPTGELVADFVAEAMRNAVKHADARAIELTVTVDEHAVRIRAFNEGVLARPSNGAGAGIGLRLLAARALDHRAYVVAGATRSGGWSTTLALARDAPSPSVRDAPATGAA
ncbi:MAG TPA: hypothetical protein VFU94_10185 [Conexibacter sp.]|nr:hypothetical protein [Conexibacter sp.]